jgi:hypothetical protein
MDVANPMNEQWCTATSKQSGERCKRAPIRGGSVCHYHGGSSPQAQRSARQMLAELHSPAIRRYARALQSDDDRTALKAAGDVMKHSIDFTPSGAPPPTWTVDVAGARERIARKFADIVARTGPSLPEHLRPYASDEEWEVATNLFARWAQRWREAQKNGERDK